MASAPHRLPSGRAERLEPKLRTRAAQLKAPEQLRSSPTALGLCRTCATIVHAGERLAIEGIYLFHADCRESAAHAAETL